jgi:hypothetical protein
MSGKMLVGIETQDKFEIHDRIIASLRALKIPDDDISKAQRAWSFVYCRMILNRIEASVAFFLPNVKAENEIESLPKDSERGLPLPEAVRNWITPKSLNDATLTKLVDEYANVWSTGTMKDPRLIPFDQALIIPDKH